MSKNGGHIIILSITILAFFLVCCERVDPEMEPGTGGLLQSQPSERMVSLNPDVWVFGERLGNFFFFNQSPDQSEWPAKGDLVVYPHSEDAFFGQVISLDQQNGKTVLEIKDIPLNELFTFFAFRDTLQTLGNGYQYELDSLLSINSDTLIMRNVSLNIKEGSFLRGTVYIDLLQVYEIGRGEVFFYLTPDRNGEVVTRQAKIQWNQELVMKGNFKFVMKDNQQFAHRQFLRSRKYSNSIEGFPVDVVVEDYLLINWYMPGNEGFGLNFNFLGNTDFMAGYQDQDSWSLTNSANFTPGFIELDGWSMLKSGYVNIQLETKIQPVFSGKTDLAAVKTIELAILAHSEWPLWQISGELKQKNSFFSDNSTLEDLPSMSYETDSLSLDVLTESGVLENASPTADFTISPPNGFTNTEFKLNGRSSSDQEDDNETLQVRWDFEGDGLWDTGYSINKLVTRLYPFAGTYTIRMEVIDSQGATAIATKQLIVSRTSSAPIAAFTVSPESGKQSDLFTFDASGCYDAEDPLSILEVRWDFQSDGVWDYAYSTQKAAVWIFGSPGEYMVKLEVKDSDGLTGSTTRIVTVTEGNTKPVAFYSVDPESGTTETRFSFDASESSDLEDDPDDLLIRWDFENDGIWDTDLRTTKTVTHQYLTAGNYTALLEVHDSGGFSNTYSRVIVVSQPNTPPTADFSISPTTGTVETKFVFDASFSKDAEDSTEQLEVRWDWDNDDVYDTEFTTTKTFSRQFEYPGTYIIKVQVRDSGGLTGIRAKLLVIN